jgi:hypothetical protein
MYVIHELEGITRKQSSAQFVPLRLFHRFGISLLGTERGSY